MIFKLPKDERVVYAGLYVDIPEGFETDGASIPSFLSWIGEPFDTDTFIPALVHDYLYKQPINRKVADLIFLDMMKQYNTPFFKRHLYYRAVRAFGWLHKGKTLV